MAEYIKKENAIPYLTKYIPSVEAVECAKINKAILEIEKLKRQADFIFMNDYAEGYKSGLDEAVEIIKRNIGE